MKLIKYFHLISIIAIPCSIVVATNAQTNILKNSEYKSSNLNSGQIDDPNVTEEQKKAAQDKFWLEFGITAGVLGLIIIICLILYFTRRRK